MAIWDEALPDIASGIGDFLRDYGMQIALAAQAASVFARKQAEEKASAKREQYISAQQQRAKSISDESQARYKALAEGFGAAQQEQQRKQQESEINARLQPQAPPSAVAERYATAQGEAPQIVGQRIQVGLQDAKESAADLARRKALASSFGANTQLNAINMKQVSDALSSAARRAKSSAGVLPLELAGANTAGRKYRTISDILAGAGTLASLPALRAMR